MSDPTGELHVLLLISERLAGKLQMSIKRKHFPPWIMKRELISESFGEVSWQYVHSNVSANYRQLNMASVLLDGFGGANFTLPSVYDSARWFHLFQVFDNPFEIQFPSSRQPNVPLTSCLWLKIKQQFSPGGKE